jgi:hypothetical protein
MINEVSDEVAWEILMAVICDDEVANHAISDIAQERGMTVNELVDYLADKFTQGAFIYKIYNLQTKRLEQDITNLQETS